MRVKNEHSVPAAQWDEYTHLVRRKEYLEKRFGWFSREDKEKIDVEYADVKNDPYSKIIGKGADQRPAQFQ